jgi:hypothetical protein
LQKEMFFLGQKILLLALYYLKLFKHIQMYKSPKGTEM